MAIGVFDSGLGGLSVLKHLKLKHEHESFLYIADSSNAPYGNKSDAFIRKRAMQIAGFLVDNEVSAIVVACNTATAAAIKNIRECFDIPIVAMEPGLKPASLLTKTGKIGVLATASTLKSQQYQDLITQYTKDIRCYEQAAHGLVELIEAGKLSDASTYCLVREYIEPMLEKGVDSIVLGCTHYPFLINVFREIAGDDINIIDTGAAISEQLGRVMNDVNAQNSVSGSVDVFFSSGNLPHAEKMINRLLGIPVKVKALEI